VIIVVSIVYFKPHEIDFYISTRSTASLERMSFFRQKTTTTLWLDKQIYNAKGKYYMK